MVTLADVALYGAPIVGSEEGDRPVQAQMKRVRNTQMYLSSEPLFVDTMEAALTILRRQTGANFTQQMIVTPALTYLAQLSASEIATIATRLDLSTAYRKGAGRLKTVAVRPEERQQIADTFVDLVHVYPSFRWSARWVLLCAILGYCEHVIRADTTSK